MLLEKIFSSSFSRALEDSANLMLLAPFYCQSKLEKLREMR